MMEEIKNQWKQVLRRLAKAPMFTVITVITLAAAVGGNTVVFSVLQGVLLKPLPYPHPEELVSVWHTAPGLNIPQLPASPSTYFIYRDQSVSFQDIGLYTGDSMSITGQAEPERVPALLVTDGTLSILGVPPLLGRTFTRQDDVPGAPDTVVLTYGYWKRKFAGDSSAVGRTILANGKQREIIGVMPQSFHFLDGEDPALIVPFQFDRAKMFLGQFSYQAVARLRPGVTIERASADVARMLPIVNRTFPAPEGFSLKLFEEAKIGPNIKPLKQDVVGDVGNVLWVLMASIGLVLLIACANIANLLLVRVEGRRQELAVRSALGAAWGRIAAELLFESVILGLFGSAVGLGLAYLALHALVTIAPTGLPRINQIGIDLNVILFTLGLSLFASLLFGSIPIVKHAGAKLSTGLRGGSRTLSQSKEQHRARNVLVVVQVALALVLLICSGLMIRTFRALTQVEPGFSSGEQVETFRIAIPEALVKEDESVMRVEEEMARKLSAIPGVTSVGIGGEIPMDGNNSNDPVFAEDHNYTEGQLPPLRRFKFISPGLRQTLGTPLIAGRDVTWDDLYKSQPVVLISENLAKEYWNDPRSSIGKRIRVATTDPWREVIGVVADVRDDGVNKDAPTIVYWPLMMKKFEGNEFRVGRAVSYAIRSPRTGSESFMKEVRAAVWSVNANLPLSEVRTLQGLLNRSMARTSFTLVMLAVAGGMALLLGVVGIYGVIAYSVSQRTREIGIRMALGAQHEMVTRMFVRHGLLLTGVGIAFGLATAVGVMRLMSSLLFKVNPVDPVTYLSVSAGLLATAFLACYLPSRRAAAVDPVEALRAE